MGFKWDEKKRQSKLKKHGIDFDYAKQIREGPLLRLSKRYQSKERWFPVIGKVDERTIAIVYTHRRGHKRIISARPANRTEREAYERQAW